MMGKTLELAHIKTGNECNVSENDMQEKRQVESVPSAVNTLSPLLGGRRGEWLTSRGTLSTIVHVIGT